MMLALAGCVGDSGGSNDAGSDADLTGTEGHACFANKTCNAGLSCISDVCVSLDAGSSDAASSDATADAPPDAGSNLAVAVVKTATGASPLVLSIDPGTSANRLLVVGLSFAPNGLKAGLTVTLGSSLLQDVTGGDVTVAGNNNPSGYGGCTSRIFYMVNPPSGAANITATFSGVASPIYAVAGAVVFSGAHQTTPIQNATHTSGSSTAIAIAITTAAGHMTLANECGDSGNVTTTMGTQQWLSTGNLDGAGSTNASTTTTSQHKWIQGAGYAWVASGVDVVPAP